MKLSWRKALGGFFLAAVLSLPAMGSNTALPGTLNFIEGQASIQSQPLTSKSVGSAELQPGQTLTTENGRAEVLLTPGVFLRLDNNSAVKMISPNLTNTEIELDHGRAAIEVDQIHKENNIRVKQNDATTQLKKTGFYGFSSEPDQVRVYKGEAEVADGSQTAKLKGGHQLNLNTSGKLKPEKFDKNDSSDFYAWSKLRSEYLAEASANAAQVYVSNGWVGPGWYWDPWFSGFTFVPGAGIAYSPFGWGFYSPAVIYPYGFYGAPIVRRPVVGYYHVPRYGAGIRPIAPHAFPHVGGFHGGFRR